MIENMWYTSNHIPAATPECYNHWTQSVILESSLVVSCRAFSKFV